MAPKIDSDFNASVQKVVNKGAWTAEEDRKLSECIEVHGATRWKTVAIKSGLSRSGKSCRLRWLNYLRPNIKRGNISDEEEDLILRLHKLLGNRWSLIAGRLPGRTDNEIKNYWNSHLSKKINQKQKEKTPIPQKTMAMNTYHDLTDQDCTGVAWNLDINQFLDFSLEEFDGFEWVNKFLDELGDQEDPLAHREEVSINV